MAHPLKKYSRVLTRLCRLCNIFFWNNFPGIISSRGRYTIMHVGTLKIMIPPFNIPRNNSKFWKIFYNLKRPNTSWNSLNVPIPGLALPKTIPSLAVFAWKLPAGNANCIFLRHHAVWAIAANIFLCSVPASTTSVQRTTFLSRYFLESFGWQWREYGRNRGKHTRLGKCLGDGQVECHLVGFPQEKLF